MNTTTSWVIQTQGLCKSYKEVDALKNLDLQVRDKSIFAFLGPNGAGKTTMIKLLRHGRILCAMANLASRIEHKQLQPCG